ncbi:unknown protein [Parachlamydia acanthamoebae UV-7]|uniref:Uncharacterized protein n=1 Tax=Parachlamydia acanthamoebae (strain UV7) TaxID=765952 RepID=F8L140_PARAV|nr:unknown protein [Parachlamydia acanthamoebae UV-7]
MFFIDADCEGNHTDANEWMPKMLGS